MNRYLHPSKAESSFLDCQKSPRIRRTLQASSVLQCRYYHKERSIRNEGAFLPRAKSAHEKICDMRPKERAENRSPFPTQVFLFSRFPLSGQLKANGRKSGEADRANRADKPTGQTGQTSQPGTHQTAEPIGQSYEIQTSSNQQNMTKRGMGGVGGGGAGWASFL